MADTFSQIYLQLVFDVKHRQNLIAKEHKKELHKYITYSTALVQHRNAKMLESGEFINSKNFKDVSTGRKALECSPIFTPILSVGSGIF